MEADPAVVVWLLTRIELRSALARRQREAGGADAAIPIAERRLTESWDGWSIVDPVEDVLSHAERLLHMHTLRASDALQLAAARVAAGADAGDLEFVTFDKRQAAAAAREGFRVLTA